MASDERTLQKRLSDRYQIEIAYEKKLREEMVIIKPEDYAELKKGRPDLFGGVVSPNFGEKEKEIPNVSAVIKPVEIHPFAKAR